MKLTRALAGPHHSGDVKCEACDVPVSEHHLYILCIHIRYPVKPHLGAMTARERAEASVAMALIFHGTEVVDTNRVMMGSVNTNSPPLVDWVLTEAIQAYRSDGQGIVVVSSFHSGAMGLVSTFAPVAEALAEAMVCCDFAQLIRPGAPFMLGNFLSSISLRSDASTLGMPEPVISNLSVVT